MKNGFVKLAAACPEIRVADPAYNAAQCARLALEAADAGACIVTFPELTLTGCTSADLLFSQTLLSQTKEAFHSFLHATEQTDLISIVGLPLATGGKLYSCAAVCQGGRVLGLVPKTRLSTSDKRYFSSQITQDTACDSVPFGKDLIFACDSLPELRFAVVIGADADAAFPHSALQCAAGAALILNPCADAQIVGRASAKETLVLAASARTLSAYLSVSAGIGESTTDLVFGGHRILAECGKRIASVEPLAKNSELMISEIDVQKISAERRKNPDFADNYTEKYREIHFFLPLTETALTRRIEPLPFIPSASDALDERCNTVLAIQVEGLKQRLIRAYAKKAVIGISGGLDSTLALLIAARAMDELGRPRSDILTVTMPCFGTTKRTKSNATVLCRELGTDFRTVNIGKSVLRHFADIGHDPSDRNVTYENGQARERTQVLMDMANDCGGMVIGTGDLSELALGWATYNGDHMSMYGVNASVPKTMMRYIVAHCAKEFEKQGEKKIAAALLDVLDTPVSPELLPADEGDKIAQKTEDLVGPYELHDFYLYYTVRYGFSPKKIYRLASVAFAGRYSDETLIKWLETFCRRFFSQQFKRSCLPDGPKVGTVSLSPRGDFCMPSDASSAPWMREIEELKAQK